MARETPRGGMEQGGCSGDLLSRTIFDGMAQALHPPTPGAKEAKAIRVGLRGSYWEQNWDERLHTHIANLLLSTGCVATPSLYCLWGSQQFRNGGSFQNSSGRCNTAWQPSHHLLCAWILLTLSQLATCLLFQASDEELACILGAQAALNLSWWHLKGWYAYILSLIV